MKATIFQENNNICSKLRKMANFAAAKNHDDRLVKAVMNSGGRNISLKTGQSEKYEESQKKG